VHRRLRRSLALLLPAAVLAACGTADGGGGGASAAGGGESCYAGERTTFVVPYSPGGGYDTIARALAPALEEELGATVVVENQPGAGGLAAANTLFETDAEERVFAILPGVGVLGAALAGADGVNYDPLEFTFVARVAPDERLMVTGPDSGLDSIEDVLDAGAVRFSSTGPGGADHIDATIVSRILGVDGEVVSGFAGSGDTALAVTSGDVDAVFSSVAGLLSGVESGDLQPVLVAGAERAQDLPDVPALMELDLDEEQQALAEAHTQLQAAGRSIVAPPGADQGCVDELSAAFETAVEDPEVLDLLEPSNEHVSYLSGDDLAEIYRSVMEDSPEEYVTLLTGAFAGQ
jgi:tripartite-type tricarboxylate transporter receptor subunit TctC